MVKTESTRNVEYKNTLIHAIHSDTAELQALFKANYKFSVLNTLSALSQLHSKGLPMGPIKTYKGWQALDRKVIKGQKALWLCMPITFQKKDKETGKPMVDENGKPVMMKVFKLKPHWFGYAQTEGKDFDYREIKDLFDFDLALERLEIKKVPFDSIHVNAGGYANIMRKELAINPTWMDKLAVASTMFHEMGHIVLEHKPDDGIDDHSKEIEAEAVSMMMFKILNIGDTNEQEGYIQNWSGGDESYITDKLASRVIKAVDKIMKAGKVEIKDGDD